MMWMSFRFNNNYVLENDFVILSPLQKQDFENLLPFALNESDLWKYSLISAGSEEKMKNYIEVALENKLLEKEYPFIVYDKKRECLCRFNKIL
jgi:hypothetical protein